jgi:CsoR family transcriptional regulator, copper-sensing transcriptional repressor
LPEDKRKQVSMRVRRIHGHVHAITEMLDEGRSYTEIVHQLSAVRSALDGAIQAIVDDLVEDCVSKMERREPFEDTLQELKAVVASSR